MKKYTTHKTLLLCLILVSLLFAACKDKGNEEVKQPTATTTALEGTWVHTEAAIGTSTLTFTGANFSQVEAGQYDYADPASPDPNNPTILGSIAVASNVSGTFKLNNNQILVTPTAANLSLTITLTGNSPSPTQNYTGQEALSNGGSNLQMNQEGSLGTYTLNGNILSLTFTGDSQATSFNKQ